MGKLCQNTLTLLGEPPHSRHTNHARDRLGIGCTTALPDGADFVVCFCGPSARRGRHLRRGQLFSSLPDAGDRPSDRARSNADRCHALPVLIGLVVGLGGAIAIASALRSLLFEVTPTDPVTLGSVVLVLLLTSGLACYLPARRAAPLDPMVVLRHE
jgi:hypothetical protein